MTAIAEPPTKAKKAKKPRVCRLTLSHGPMIPVEPIKPPHRFYMPEDILSASPMEMSELASYFDGLTNGQLRRGWKGTFAAVLTESHESLGILTRKEYRGLVRSTILALEVIHTRFIRDDGNGQTPIEEK